MQALRIIEPAPDASTSSVVTDVEAPAPGPDADGGPLFRAISDVLSTECRVLASLEPELGQDTIERLSSDDAGEQGLLAGAAP